MPEEKPPLKVFLCHASTDKSKVKEYHRALKRRGFQPWLDEIDLLPGQDWQFEIPRAIETSDAIIIFLSNESVDKAGYVQKEIKFALDKALEMPEGRIFIIPARLESCDVPASLKKYQWVDLFARGGREKLMNVLELLADQKNLFHKKPNTKEKPDPEKYQEKNAWSKQKIRLKTQKLDEVLAFLENNLQNLYPKSKSRAVALDNYPDGIKRTITYTDTLAFPQRGKNGLVVQCDAHMTVFPGEFDANTGETTIFNTYNALKFTGWETQTVYLEFEYAKNWEDLADSLIDELHKLFGKYDGNKKPVHEIKPSTTSEPVQNIYKLNVGENPGNIIIDNDNVASSQGTKKERPTQPRPASISKQVPPQTLKPEHKIAIIVAIIGLIGTICAALIGVLPQFFPLAAAPTATTTPTMTATVTNLPLSKTPELTTTPTPTPTTTPTLTSTFTATLTPTLIQVKIEDRNVGPFNCRSFPEVWSNDKNVIVKIRSQASFFILGRDETSDWLYVVYETGVSAVNCWIFNEKEQFASRESVVRLPVYYVYSGKPRDGMVYVPAGDFLMGNNQGETDQKPEHMVYLDSYYIDQFEVTYQDFVLFLNGYYKSSAEAKADQNGYYITNRMVNGSYRGMFSLLCTNAVGEDEDTCRGWSPKIYQQSSKFFVRDGYDDYPVIMVTYYGAMEYCSWRELYDGEDYKVNLPTEAQWEKAAKGSNAYPYANKVDYSNCNFVNYYNCKSGEKQKSTAPVTDYIQGISPYGAYHMVGNVWEWVLDWYSANSYSDQSQQGYVRNPTGPTLGTIKVFRGASYADILNLETNEIIFIRAFA
jgi:formylglycine-generating enzyme required for sulfatase activity